jgi:hypothetical protein
MPNRHTGCHSVASARAMQASTYKRPGRAPLA